jgi:hypothetical protein
MAAPPFSLLQDPFTALREGVNPMFLLANAGDQAFVLHGAL